MLHPSVCLSSSVTLCIVAKRCVLEQKLLLRAYRKSYMRNEKSIGTKMNDLDLCLEVVSVTSAIALHLTVNISETVRDRGLVRNDHQ